MKVNKPRIVRSATVCRCLLALAAAISCVALFAEPSRCTLGEAKFMSWAPRERPWTLKGGLLHLDAKPDKATAFGFNRVNDARFLAAFASGPAYRVTFKYRSTAKASLIGDAFTMNPLVGGTRPGSTFCFEKALPVSGAWREFSWDMPAPQQECETFSLKLTCGKGEGFVEVKEVSITDVPPEDKSGKPLLLNGAKAEEVCLYAKDTPRRRDNDLSAALMFRFALRAAGGAGRPPRELRLRACVHASQP